jgi:hypothetical protein
MTIYAGNRVTADVLDNLAPLSAYRASDSSQNLTTTLTNDDVLVIPLAANGVYIFWFNLVYSGSSKSGFKYTVSAPSGSAGHYNLIADNAGGGSFQGEFTMGQVYAVTIGTTNARYSTHGQGLVTCGNAPGNLVIQYAENASDTANGAYVRLDSFIIAQKIG